VPPPTADDSPSAPQTLADLIARLDGVPPSRVLLRPWPGTATERDVLHALDHEDRICELVDGTLVEKAMGFEESFLAGWLLTHISHRLLNNPLGNAVGADGIVKLTTGLVRVPDLCFISWDRLPGRKFPKKPIPKLAIDLAVEFLSKGNTGAEMDRKLREYFEVDARLVWYVEPMKRLVRVYSGDNRPRLLRDGDTLDGGAVLPGFALEIAAFVDRVGRRPGA
jgi:Uma2 family endonuclease